MRKRHPQVHLVTSLEPFLSKVYLHKREHWDLRCAIYEDLHNPLFSAMQPAIHGAAHFHGHQRNLQLVKTAPFTPDFSVWSRFLETKSQFVAERSPFGSLRLEKESILKTFPHCHCNAKWPCICMYSSRATHTHQTYKKKNHSHKTKCYENLLAQISYYPRSPKNITNEN